MATRWKIELTEDHAGNMAPTPVGQIKKVRLIDKEAVGLNITFETAWIATADWLDETMGPYRTVEYAMNELLIAYENEQEKEAQRQEERKHS
jgi:hypothetical protein